MNNKNNLFYSIIEKTCLWASAAFFLFPLIWMISGSFKNQSATVKMPPELIPTEPTLINYNNLLFDSSILRWMVNSIIVSVSATILLCLIASMAGYAITKTEFKGKNLIFTVILASMLIPRQLTLVPMFSLMRDLELVNKLPSVIIPVIAMPFGVFMMKQFSQTTPTELLQAGRIDGCSEIGLFLRIFLPIVKPGLGALAIFTFATAWNDYMWQLVMLSSSSTMTIPVGIATLIGEYVAEYGKQMAAATIGMIPTTLVFIIFQRYFVKGITLGGVKG